MWYVKNRRPFIAVFIAVVVVAMVLLYFLAHLDITWCVLIFALAVALIQMPIDIYFSRKIGRETNKAIDMDCDPERFLENTEMMRRYLYGKRSKGYMVCTMNLSAGYNATGEYDKSIAALMEIEDRKALNGSYYAIWLANLANAYIGQEKYAEAKEQLQILKTTKFIPAKRQYTTAVYRIRVRHDMLENAEEYYQGIYDSPYSNKEKAEISYEMGLLYEKKGEIAKARAKYKDASDIGNKLICAKMARDKLGRI